MGVAVAPAADRLDLTPLAQQVLHQHGVHIHRAEVIFQNADMMPLRHEIGGISAQERRLARAQKACDKVYLYHCDPLRCFDLRVSIIKLPPLVKSALGRKKAAPAASSL